MKQKIWRNVTVITINEALRIGYLKLDGSLIVEEEFSYAIGAWLARSRLVSHFQGKDMNYATVIDAAMVGNDPISNSWGTRPYKNLNVCSVRVRDWMEIEKGPYVKRPKWLSHNVIMVRRGFGSDIAAMKVEPMGYEIREFG